MENVEFEYQNSVFQNRPLCMPNRGTWQVAVTPEQKDGSSVVGRRADHDDNQQKHNHQNTKAAHHTQNSSEPFTTTKHLQNPVFSHYCLPRLPLKVSTIMTLSGITLYFSSTSLPSRAVGDSSPSSIRRWCAGLWLIAVASSSTHSCSASPANRASLATKRGLAPSSGVRRSNRSPATTIDPRDEEWFHHLLVRGGQSAYNDDYPNNNNNNMNNYPSYNNNNNMDVSSYLQEQPPPQNFMAPPDGSLGGEGFVGEDPFHETVQDRVEAWRQAQRVRSENLTELQKASLHDEQGRVKLLASVSKGSRALLFFILLWRDVHLYEVADQSLKGIVRLLAVIPLVLLFTANMAGVAASLSSPSHSAKKRLKAILNLDKLLEAFLLVWYFIRLTVAPPKYVPREILIASTLHSVFFIFQCQAFTRLAWDDVKPEAASMLQEEDVGENPYQQGDNMAGWQQQYPPN